MTKPDGKNNNGSVEPSVSAAAGSVDHPLPSKAKQVKQTSRESLSRRNTESEVEDDGTNTFFW